MYSTDTTTPLLDLSRCLQELNKLTRPFFKSPPKGSTNPSQDHTTKMTDDSVDASPLTMNGDTTASKNLATIVRTCQGHMDTLANACAAQEAQLKDTKSKFDTELAAMTSQISSMQSKHASEKADLQKQLDIANDKLLSSQCELHKTKADLSIIEAQLRKRPVTAAAPHHVKNAPKNPEVEKKIEAANAARAAARQDLEATKTYDKVKIDQLCNDLRELHAGMQKLGVQKQVAYVELQYERARAEELAVQLDDVKRKLAQANRACEGNSACTSCVDHLRIGLHIARAHEVEAGKQFDDVWVSYMRLLDQVAAEKAGLSSRVAEENGKLKPETNGKLTAEENEKLNGVEHIKSEKGDEEESEEGEDEESETDDSDFEVIVERN